MILSHSDSMIYEAVGSGGYYWIIITEAKPRLYLQVVTDSE